MKRGKLKFGLPELSLCHSAHGGGVREGRRSRVDICAFTYPVWGRDLGVGQWGLTQFRGDRALRPAWVRIL